MFAKCSLLLLACLVAYAQASPHHHKSAHDSSEEKPGDHHHEGHHPHVSNQTEDGHHHPQANQSEDGHHHDGGHHHGHHHHHHGPNDDGQGPFHINRNSSYYKVKDLTSKLYTEIFVLATGDNYLSPEVANDVHVSARAVVLLTQKLRDQTYAYEVLANVSSDCALKGAKVEDKQVVTDLVNEVVSKLSTLPDFATIKAGLTESFISRQKYFKKDATPEEKEKVLEDEWLKDPLVKLAVLNRIFYTFQLKKMPHAQFINVLSEHAQDAECGEKLEKIYATALAKVVEETCPGHNEKKAAGLLVEKLMQQLADDAPLSVKMYGAHKLLFIDTDF